MRITVFYNVMPCSLAEIHRSIGNTYCTNTHRCISSVCWLKAMTVSCPTGVPKSQNNKMSSTEATTIFCFEVLVVFTCLPFFQPQPQIIKRRTD